MKKTTLLLLLLAFTSIAFAQRGNQKWYNIGIGGRIEFGENDNDMLGFTFEKGLTTATSLELLAISDFKSGIEFSGIYKYIAPFPEVPPSFRWYIGGGAHVGFWNEMVIGGTGLLGMGYTFNNLPLNICVDWHPLLNIIGPANGVDFISKFGITARYIVQ